MSDHLSPPEENVSPISEPVRIDSDGDDSLASSPKRGHTGPAKSIPQRLAKILAAAGVDARRKCEELVSAGRVTVDGKVITDLAFRADPFSQRIELDGEKLKLQRKVYFMLNKPRGVVCTNHDPSGRPRVIDLFPQFRERLFTIGRLDEESEGLLLVTNDGELANRMAHPRYRVPKFYLCHVKGVPTTATLAALKRGMYFEEGKFSVEGVRLKKVVGDSAYLDIVLNEGQNREIRRLLARVDHKVMRLKRVGFGPIRLGDLPSGAFRQLTIAEVKLLTELSEQRAHLDRPRGRKREDQFGKRRFGAAADARVGRPLFRPASGDRTDSARGISTTDRPARGDRSRTTRRPPQDVRRPRTNEEFVSEGMQRTRRYRSDDDTRRGRSSDNRRPFVQPVQDVDHDFGGGRRRFVTDETSESTFARRPQRGSRPPNRTERPLRRQQRDDEVKQGGGENFRGRRPASRPPRQGGYGSARTRSSRNERPVRLMTADGKEILQGKVTGYRTQTQEGPARRRYTAIQGMQINRKQRQQRRRKNSD
jgi:23S rRNA pseudouridine2605 synthase